MGVVNSTLLREAEYFNEVMHEFRVRIKKMMDIRGKVRCLAVDCPQLTMLRRCFKPSAMSYADFLSSVIAISYVINSSVLHIISKPNRGFKIPALLGSRNNTEFDVAR